MLEESLEKLFRAMFNRRSISSSLQKDLFDSNGPLSSFSSKSKLAYALGMIGAEAFSDLDAVRRIRNQFAHSTTVVDFIDPQLSFDIERMYCVQPYAGRIDRYATSVALSEDAHGESAYVREQILRVKGYVKRTKSLFALGVQDLAIECECGTELFQRAKEQLAHARQQQRSELPASQAWGELEQFLQGRTNDLSYLVLPRAAKYLQTIGFTLGELLRRFSEFMARPQTALIIAGYGFGDEHINRLIRSAMLNPTLQIVVYLPEFSGSVDDRALAPTVRRLLALNNPRLTMVGGVPGAFFDKLAEHLPDPTVFNEDLKDLERRLRPIVPDHDLPDGDL
jgi:hypothetical protein